MKTRTVRTVGIWMLMLLLLLCLTASAEQTGVAVDETNFPDSAFRKYISEYVDINPKDGSLSEAEIAACESMTLNNLGISSLKGIGIFTNLESLSCQNNNLTMLDLSGLTKLTDLRCNNNKLTALNVNPCRSLIVLDCFENDLTALKLTPSVEIVNCRTNKLTNLVVSDLNQLRDLTCHGNKLTSLDVSKCSKLCNLVLSIYREYDSCSNADTWFLYNSGEDATCLYVDPNLPVQAGTITSTKPGWANGVMLDEVSLTLEYPAVGSSSYQADPKLTVPEGSHYWVETAAWLTLNGSGAEMTFEAGKDYYIGFFLEGEEKWGFSDSVKVSVTNAELTGEAEVIYESGYYLLKGTLTMHMPKDETSDPGSTAVESITLNKSKATLTRTSKKKKPTVTLKVTVSPADATDSSVEWSSSNVKVAKVNADGKVTALKAGKAVITCTAKDGSGVSAKCTITVKDKKVTKLKLNKTKATLKKGKTLKLKVKEVKPSDASNKQVRWTSSDKKIATVDKNGKVKAKKKGTCTITCTAADGSGVTAECRITVK